MERALGEHPGWAASLRARGLDEDAIESKVFYVANSQTERSDQDAARALLDKRTTWVLADELDGMPMLPRGPKRNYNEP